MFAFALADFTSVVPSVLRWFKFQVLSNVNRCAGSE